MKWYGVTFWDYDAGEPVAQAMHGPFEDDQSFDNAVSAAFDEALDYGDGVVAVILPFELMTDDVPEVISREEIEI
jgi:hypothetical protein